MGCSSAYLIDWLTLKLPVSASTHPALFERVRALCGHVVATDKDGVLSWEKRVLDLDELRSDSPGLFWQLSGDGKSDVLIIGASPASLQHGLNLFGSLDIRECAGVLIERASKALELLLPGLDAWQCRRIDVTANYALPDSSAVKTALSQLLVSDGARRRAGSGKRSGDSVYWSPSSDLNKGKAYHKGPQVAHLIKKQKIGPMAYELTPDHLELLGRVLRLEHTRGSRWFRRLEESGVRWQDLTEQQLIQLHTEFFSPLLASGIEVKQMEKPEIVRTIMLANKCTERQALAAYSTYRNCREDGFTHTKDSMTERTFYLHQKLLRVAGISDMHLRTAKLIPFPRVRFDVAKPVASWEEIRRAA